MPSYNFSDNEGKELAIIYDGDPTQTPHADAELLTGFALGLGYDLRELMDDSPKVDIVLSLGHCMLGQMPVDNTGEIPGTKVLSNLRIECDAGSSFEPIVRDISSRMQAYLADSGGMVWPMFPENMN